MFFNRKGESIVEGQILVFSGYAGAGKNTVINELLNKYRDLKYIPSVTTRDKREGETEGRPYFFRSREVFEELMKQGMFIESEKVHGNWYGTIKSKYDECLEKGNIVIKDIDVNGAMEFKRLYGNKVCMVFIKPTEDREVINRMRLRGDSEEEIKKRMMRISYESAFIDRFDTVVINDDIGDAVKQCERIIDEVLINSKR